MTNLEIAKKAIGENVNAGIGLYGLFDSRNIAGDTMTTIYAMDGLMIDYADNWDYFEVFGLTEEDFESLNSYYNRLKKRVAN